jgi:SAM-dependent methyltransferase
MSSDWVSKRYREAAGLEYSTWQLNAASGMGAVEARKFAAFISSNSVVIDFGCGGGEVLAAISGARRIGIEPNPASANKCAERGIEIVASLEELPSGVADVVISNHALEHCTRPLDELRGIRRVLKDNGRVVIVVPIDDWRKEKRFRPADINHHLYTWTPLLLGNLLLEAGFSVERIELLTHAWPPGARWLARIAPRRVFDACCTGWSLLNRQRQIRAVASSISTR